MFVDRIQLKLVAGKGGNGIVAWRREKFLPKGGPWGGNGGRGGSVILQADSDTYSLDHYRNRQILKAQNGKEGGINLRQGKSGQDLVLKVPYGTLVKNLESGEILFDFTPETSSYTLCVGGKGGKGNNCFKTSTNRAPNKCTPGTLGEEKEIELELKLIADVGLVGMPNAGKSTLMGQITHARAKVGAYPFTTLAPNLGTIQCDDYTRIFVADIPGIIADAHQDRGLGLSFLKHVERTSTLAFVLDVDPDEEERNALSDLEMLRKELFAYDPKLMDKPFVVALNKVDKEGAGDAIAAFQKEYPFPKETLFTISAATGEGLGAFLKALQTLTRDQVLARELIPT